MNDHIVTSFQAELEEGDLIRVVIPNIPLDQMEGLTQRLEKHGYSDFLIRSK